ncbi:MAG: ROK family protein [Chloroflexota bacterium]
MPGTYAVGVDVGATKILAGVIDYESGSLVSTVKLASPMDGADSVVDAVGEAVSRAMFDAPKDIAKQVKRIGLGVAGQVDRATGLLYAAPNLGGGIENVQLAKPLRDRFNVPVALGNDVEAAALGESKFGAGRGKKLFACVFVGTGIGGALVQDGVRYRGASGSAGEIGHIMVQAGGRLCGCGQKGHLEAYASRTAIVAMLREKVQAGAESSLSALLLDTSQRVRSKPLWQAVQDGDKLVVEGIQEAANYLALGLSTLINLWNPERVVLGGGVIDRIDMLFNLAAEGAKQLSLPIASSAVDIVRAELGDNSGMVGAALIEPPKGK